MLGDGTRPTKATSANRIRAGLIRFLVLGGDEAHPVHENGVQLIGAWIEYPLNLTETTATVGLTLGNCWFAKPVSAMGATLTNLILRGSQLPGLSADGMLTSGAVFLDDGFTATGRVRLLGAQIGGILVCTGGTFGNVDKDGNALGDALSADGIVVTGGVFLNGDFTATGAVRLAGARIGGALFCAGGIFCNTDKDGISLGDALSADGIVVTGGVYLNEGFASTGAVRLLGARIGHNLECNGGTFRNAGKDGAPLGYALNAQAMVVTGGLIVRNCEFSGKVDLVGAHVASLVDAATCWPENSLVLDGFCYDLIAEGPTDAATRIGWLEKQVPAHLGKDFCPQPWEQLIKVLREMGHPGEAAEVAIAKQRALRKAGKIGQRRPDPRYRGWRLSLDWAWVAGANLVARGWHRIYGWLAGFGYRPTGILMWMAIVGGLSGAYFSTAADAGLMAPTSAEVFTHKELHDDLNSRGDDSASCGIQREVSPTRYWPACTELPSEYTTFNPWWYSIDLILPLVDLQQDSQWTPAATYIDAGGTMRTLPGGVLARVVMWFEILFGWFASLMFVAIAGRLVEKD